MSRMSSSKSAAVVATKSSASPALSFGWNLLLIGMHCCGCYLLGALGDSGGGTFAHAASASGATATSEYAVFECPLNALCHCIARPNTSLAHIVQVHCDGMRLYKFPELPHNSLRSVAIRNNDVRSVDDETFSGLQLEKLALDGNQLSVISDSGFRSMVNSLRELDLSDNWLQTLPRALRALRSLARLTLHGNRLQSLDGDWSSGLAHSLRMLRVSANSLCQLSAAAAASGAEQHTKTSSSSLHIASSIAQLHRLVWLDLSGNRLADVAAALHRRQLPATLVTLDLSHNLLRRMPATVFAALPQLRHLLLAGNLMGESAPADVDDDDADGGASASNATTTTTHRIHLDKLDVSDNRLRSTAVLRHLLVAGLHPHPHHQQHHIKSIALAHNALEHLPADAFRHTHAQHLVLAFNRLQSVDAAAFRTLDATLEYLDLEHNQLADTLPAALAPLRRLQYLYMTANRVRAVDADALPETLVVLSLAGNRLQRVPYAALRRCERLTYLNVGYNQIAELGASAFGAAAAAVYDSGAAVSTTAWPSTTADDGGSTTLEGSSTTSADSSINASNFESASTTQPPPTAQQLADPGWPTARLQTLLLRNNKLTALGPAAFAGLPAIREISLSFNDLHWIHPQTFARCADTLQILELSFGIRAADADGAFPLRQLRALHQLVWLGLDNNRLAAVPEHAFLPLGRLRYVSLAFNRLDALPAAGLFDAEQHTALVEVDLAYNRLGQLRPFAFDSLVALERVRLAHNRLVALHGRCFNNLPQLQAIDLAHNRLANISAHAFALLPRLRRLWLQHNRLVRLSFDWFGDVAPAPPAAAIGEHWLRLNVSHNRIVGCVELTGAQRSASAAWPALGELDLSGNRFELLTASAGHADRQLHHSAASTASEQPTTAGDAASDQPPFVATAAVLQPLGASLRTLHVHGNAELTRRSSGTLPSRLFADLQRLQHLNLAACGVLQLRRHSFHGLERVQRLNLSSNRIAQLQPEQFAGMRRLRVLDLSGNRLTAVAGADVFARTRLEWLSVRGNRLVEWPQAALAEVGFTLREVRAGGNQLAELRAAQFAATPFVAAIDVNGNALGNAQQGTGAAGAEQWLRIAALANLTRLDVSDNPLLAVHLLQQLLLGAGFASAALPPPPPSLHSVRQLRVARVGATALPARLFDAMPQLAELDAGDNRLLTVPVAMRHAHRLHALRLAGNRGLHAWSEVVARMPLALRVLDVTGVVIEGAARTARCTNTTTIRHLDTLKAVGFADSAECATRPCFWSELRRLRVLHISLSARQRDCFGQLAGLEELHLVADRPASASASLTPVSDHHHHLAAFTSTTIASHHPAPVAASAQSTTTAHQQQPSPSGDIHLDAAQMPRLQANGKLRLLDVRGAAITSIAADAFTSLAAADAGGVVVRRLTVRLHGTGVVQLPGGLFYALHAVTQLAVEVTDNRRLAALAPSVFYPNVSVWDAVGTRSVVGGLDVHANGALVCDCGLVWLGHWLRRWLRETAQMKVVTGEEAAAMLERARRNGCFDPATGDYVSFLDLFPEDLLCHASALSSGAARGAVVGVAVAVATHLLTLFLIVVVVVDVLI